MPAKTKAAKKKPIIDTIEIGGMRMEGEELVLNGREYHPRSSNDPFYLETFLSDPNKIWDTRKQKGSMMLTSTHRGKMGEIDMTIRVYGIGKKTGTYECSYSTAMNESPALLRKFMEYVGERD